MSRTLAGVLAGMFLLAFACGAVAGIPDPDQSSVDKMDISGTGMATCTSLDGEPYSSLKITAKRSDTTPIEGIPYNSFFFLVTGGDVNFSHVTAATDVNGEILFDVDDNECIVGDITIEAQIYTVVLNDSDVLSCNCYDINEDGGVGAQDFALFVADYGTAATRSDFNWDGGVGAQDFALFVSHYGH
jgi:hypothetical protein